MLHDICEAIENKCKECGESSPKAFFIRAMALSFALGFASFEGLYRFHDQLRMVKTLLMVASVFGFALTALSGILLLLYVVGQRSMPQRKVHHHSW